MNTIRSQKTERSMTCDSICARTNYEDDDDDNDSDTEEDDP